MLVMGPVDQWMVMVFYSLLEYVLDNFERKPIDSYQWGPPCLAWSVSIFLLFTSNFLEMPYMSVCTCGLHVNGPWGCACGWSGELQHCGQCEPLSSCDLPVAGGGVCLAHALHVCMREYPAWFLLRRHGVVCEMHDFTVCMCVLVCYWEVFLCYLFYHGCVCVCVSVCFFERDVYVCVSVCFFERDVCVCVSVCFFERDLCVLHICFIVCVCVCVEGGGGLCRAYIY